MATLVTHPISEAEAYVAEGAREIGEQLKRLLHQHRRSRPFRPADLFRSVAEYPVAAAAALVVGAVLAGVLADRLIARNR